MSNKVNKTKTYKNYVYVTQFGKVPFIRVKRVSFLENGVEYGIQYQGKIRLPKNFYTGDNKKWYMFDCYFLENEIFNN